MGPHPQRRPAATRRGAEPRAHRGRGQAVHGGRVGTEPVPPQAAVTAATASMDSAPPRPLTRCAGNAGTGPGGAGLCAFPAACARSGSARGAPGRRCCADVSGRASRAVSRCCGRFPPSAAAPFPRPPPGIAPGPAERAGTRRNAGTGARRHRLLPAPAGRVPLPPRAARLPSERPGPGRAELPCSQCPCMGERRKGSRAGPGKSGTTARPGRERRRLSAGCLGEPPRQRLLGCAQGPLHSFLLVFIGKTLCRAFRNPQGCVSRPWRP